MRRRWIFIVPFAIAGMIVFATVGAWIVQLLWNWLVPTLFGGPTVTLWQALGLLLLCRILFGGFGFHGGRSRFRHRMDERWEHLTPEERERFRQRMRARFGFGPPPEESKG